MSTTMTIRLDSELKQRLDQLAEATRAYAKGDGSDGHGLGLHLVNRFGTYDLEADTEATALEQPLSEMGFEVNTRDLTSGLHVIEIGEGLKGAADPRREGIALGG